MYRLVIMSRLRARYRLTRGRLFPADVVPGLATRAITWRTAKRPYIGRGVKRRGLRPLLEGHYGPVASPCEDGVVVAGLHPSTHLAPCGPYAVAPPGASCPRARPGRNTRRGAQAPRQHQHTAQPRLVRGAIHVEGRKPRDNISIPLSPGSSGAQCNSPGRKPRNCVDRGLGGAVTVPGIGLSNKKADLSAGFYI